MSVFEGTPLEDDVKQGRFTMAGELENLLEEKTFIENLNLPDSFFWAMHQMDAVPLAGSLGRDKKNMIKKLETAMTTMDEKQYDRMFKENRL